MRNPVPPTIPRCRCRMLVIALQACSSGRVEFMLLGPVAAVSNGRQLALGGPRQRALLALLLLRANEIVSRDRLVEGLWGERAPEGARRSLDSYVSRLRAVLGSDRIVRPSPGYVILVEEGELDLAEFRALADRGRIASSRGDAAVAAECFRDALSLWRGAALANVLDEPFASVEADRLEEEKLVAIEERIAADLDLGGGAELVSELEGLVEAHPFREQLVLQLMLALYRSGRQAEALDAYQACRRRLSGELGLEPMPELQELQRRMPEDHLRAEPVYGCRRTEPSSSVASMGDGSDARLCVAARAGRGRLERTRTVRTVDGHHWRPPWPVGIPSRLSRLAISARLLPCARSRRMRATTSGGSVDLRPERARRPRGARGSTVRAAK